MGEWLLATHELRLSLRVRPNLRLFYEAHLLICKQRCSTARFLLGLSKTLQHEIHNERAMSIDRKISKLQDTDWVMKLPERSGIGSTEHGQLVALCFSLRGLSRDDVEERIKQLPVSVQQELHKCTRDASVVCCSPTKAMFAYQTWLEMQPKDRAEVNIMQEQRRNYQVCIATILLQRVG